MKFNKEDNEEKDLKEEDEKSEDEKVEEEYGVNKEETVFASDDEELDKVLKENEELNTRFQRLQADFINYKKRVEKEKEGLISYGMESLAFDLLPILDNFERALETEQDKEDPFFKGIQMIQDGLLGVLEKNNIKEMDSLNKPFNPEIHHAVGMEDSEEHEKDIVIRVLQKGYTMKEKVIRPAMVMVSQ
nr:nucleotide exchange factor GrpE [Tissierella sp.]